MEISQPWKIWVILTVLVVEEVLMEGRGKKVLKQRTWTRAICLPHRLGNFFQKVRLL